MYIYNLCTVAVLLIIRTWTQCFVICIFFLLQCLLSLLLCWGHFILDSQKVWNTPVKTWIVFVCKRVVAMVTQENSCSLEKQKQKKKQKEIRITSVFLSTRVMMYLSEYCCQIFSVERCLVHYCCLKWSARGIRQHSAYKWTLLKDIFDTLCVCVCARMCACVCVCVRCVFACVCVCVLSFFCFLFLEGTFH